MIVIPAIDLRGGRAVRLVRGNPEEETEYSADPVEVAERFQEEGARRLHVVDLDAALEQGDRTARWCKAICHAVAIPVQVGGGIRSLRGDRRGPGARARRAPSSARRRPRRTPRSSPARSRSSRSTSWWRVDVRGGHLMTRGWTEEGPGARGRAPRARTTPARARFLVTAIARDGTLDGPDLALYGRVLKLTDRPVIARGGVRDADDVWALRDLGCEAVVTGKALYERTLKLSQVIRG